MHNYLFNSPGGAYEPDIESTSEKSDFLVHASIDEHLGHNFSRL
jgi:hypothetical protein